MKRWLLILLLAGCGRHLIEEVPTPSPEPISPVASEKKIIVAVFAAPWCSACKSTLPELNAALNRLSASQRSRVEFRLYVVTGGNSSVPPTQADADKYKSVLRLDAAALVDPWRWTKFKAWVGGQFIIPGAAVLTADEKVLKSFRGGFEPSEVAYFAASQVK